VTKALVAASLPVRLPNLAEASIDQLLGVTFTKSTSPAYPLAVAIAAEAANYEAAVVGGKLAHFAIFARNRAEAGRARALLHYVASWKSVQIFVGGRLVQQAYQAMRVLDCYLEACGSTDWQAHCLSVIDDPLVELPGAGSLSMTIAILDKPRPKQALEIGRYTFPCMLIHGTLRLAKEHPASIADQIQAAAVHAGCDWCPHFDARNYRKVGTRTVLTDLFD
jgi:hypothetical protein